jgi:transposase
MATALFVSTDYTPERLETVAASVTDRAHARRLRAIAAILRGASRQEAAAIGGMERQTLRDWVQRFNSEGPDGLLSRKPSGRPAKLAYAQKRELLALLTSPAVKERYGVGRWRLADIAALVKDRYGVRLNEISVGRMLRSLGVVYNGCEWRAATTGALHASGQTRGRCFTSNKTQCEWAAAE